MKLTESHLRNLIKQELKQFLNINEEQNSEIYFGLPPHIINQAYKEYNDPRSGFFEPNDDAESGFASHLKNQVLTGSNKTIFDKLTFMQQAALYNQASDNAIRQRGSASSDAAKSKRSMRDLVKRRNIPSAKEFPVR